MTAQRSTKTSRGRRFSFVASVVGTILGTLGFIAQVYLNYSRGTPGDPALLSASLMLVLGAPFHVFADSVLKKFGYEQKDQEDEEPPNRRRP